jgi:uncharacterized protein YndB with AHSA1/START domain
MPAIERHIRIAAPPDAVWEVLADLPGQPRWMRDLRDVHVRTPGPPRVGTIAIGTVRMFGLSQQDPIEITVLDPPRRYAIRHLGAFRGWGELRLAPLDGGATTHLRWREELQPTVHALPGAAWAGRLPLAGPAVARCTEQLMRLIDPLFTPVFGAVFRADLRRLKRLVETGAAAPQAGPSRGAGTLG